MTAKKRPKQRKRTIRLVVIPEPEKGTRSVIVRTGEGTIAFDAPTGPPITMVCGKCGAPIVRGMAVSQIRAIVFRCNSCGAYNETLVQAP